MNKNFDRAAYGYLEQRVQSASPLELIALLYEGLLKHVRAGAAAIRRDDVTAKGESLSRCLAIIGELRCRLNHEDGGEVATNLERLYMWWTRRLMEANITSNPGVLEGVGSEASEIAAAWREIAARRGREATSSDSATTVATAAAGGAR